MKTQNFNEIEYNNQIIDTSMKEFEQSMGGNILRFLLTKKCSFSWMKRESMTLSKDYYAKKKFIPDKYKGNKDAYFELVELWKKYNTIKDIFFHFLFSNIQKPMKMAEQITFLIDTIFFNTIETDAVSEMENNNVRFSNILIYESVSHTHSTSNLNVGKFDTWAYGELLKCNDFQEKLLNYFIFLKLKKEKETPYLKLISKYIENLDIACELFDKKENETIKSKLIKKISHVLNPYMVFKAAEKELSFPIYVNEFAKFCSDFTKKAFANFKNKPIEREYLFLMEEKINYLTYDSVNHSEATALYGQTFGNVLSDFERTNIINKMPILEATVIARDLQTRISNIKSFLSDPFINSRKEKYFGKYNFKEIEAFFMMELAREFLCIYWLFRKE